ncbi:Plasmodium exported protein, unknown function [Plasmodium gonderi]|uniref:Pv-fam-d protein n=1 Tax=Plasmodium gonderi TaxID=77519 RepID=A0A1Y1JID9_PLAGO|nr:Plasmodium exported protein, unknown function [Plasmodium gonderi]GAW79864.1 Plasmodium exported protein, unknown function [Plasmodium gonderi]
MKHYKAFLFTFLVWAWESTKNGGLSNLNGADIVVQKELGPIAGRMLLEYDRLYNDDASSVYTSSTNTKRAFGNDFTSVLDTSVDDLKSVASTERMSMDASTADSIFDETDKESSKMDESMSDMYDDGSNATLDSAATLMSKRADAARKFKSHLSNSEKNKRNTNIDLSYDDLIAERLKEVSQKEKALRKELLDESSIDLKDVGKSLKKYYKEREMESMDDVTSDFNLDEELNDKIKELSTREQEALKDVLNGFSKNKKSKGKGKHVGDFSGYLLNYKKSHRDDSNFEINQNERLLKRMKEFSSKDREAMRRILKRIRGASKNGSMEDIERELKSLLNTIKKKKNSDSDENIDALVNAIGESVFADENSSKKIKDTKLAKLYGSKERGRKSLGDLRSYIDENMDDEHAEVAHMLVNKIEKYKHKMAKLQSRSKNESKFMKMRHNLKLKKILLYVPLISLITSVLLAGLLYYYWAGPLTVSAIFFIGLFSFIAGTTVSYGVLGKALFNSSLKIIDFLLGGHEELDTDHYLVKRRKYKKF